MNLADCCKGKGIGRLCILCGCAFLWVLVVELVDYWNLVFKDYIRQDKIFAKPLWFSALYGFMYLSLLFLALAGATAPTLCAVGGKQAPDAILKGIGGAFRNWRAWSLYIGFIFGCFVLIALASDLVSNVVAKILGTLFLCGCLFLLTLPGYMATRDMFYEE